MRGRSDDKGHAPFWDSLGKKFFDMPFTQADYLSSTNKQFIAELMPRYPIYTALLSGKARASIGKPHPNTIPALKLLEQEGFSYCQQIDIFDAGPKVTAIKEKIRTIRDSKVGELVHSTTPITNTANTHQYIVCNERLETFAAGMGTPHFSSQNQIMLSEPLQTMLAIQTGDRVRYVQKR